MVAVDRSNRWQLLLVWNMACIFVERRWEVRKKKRFAMKIQKIIAGFAITVGMLGLAVLVPNAKAQEISNQEWATGPVTEYASIQAPVVSNATTANAPVVAKNNSSSADANSTSLSLAATAMPTATVASSLLNVNAIQQSWLISFLMFAVMAIVVYVISEVKRVRRDANTRSAYTRNTATS